MSRSRGSSGDPDLSLCQWAPIGGMDVSSSVTARLSLPTFHNFFAGPTSQASGSLISTERLAVAALLGAVLVVGLATAADYGLTVDEFNTDDYGPKALAWYASGFKDRSQFETVEFSLWYYGPWFQMLAAYVQSFDLADRMTVRHVMTFLVGVAGLAALLPIGRLAVGQWAGLTAIVLCLLTGYFYGSLFFTITGFHGAHVLVGLVMNIVVQVWAWRGWLTRERHLPVTCAAMYWHFVDAVWIVVFASLYITPRLS